MFPLESHETINNPLKESLPQIILNGQPTNASIGSQLLTLMMSSVTPSPL